MISLAATSYDPAGYLVLPTRITNPYQGQRRGSVTATLDGGSSVYDGGYSITDQTLSATMNHPTKAQLLTLQYLVSYYSQIILCCEVGAFSAIPSFALNNNVLSITFRLTARLDT